MHSRKKHVLRNPRQRSGTFYFDVNVLKRVFLPMDDQIIISSL